MTFLNEIYAIWLREIRKSLANKWEIFISILWPLFLIFVVGIGLDSFIDSGQIGVNYTELLGPGVIAILAMSSAMSIGNSIIDDRRGFIKELLVAPISRISIFLGKILGEATFDFSINLIVAFFFLLFINALNLVSMLWVLFFMLLIAFGFYGFGIVLSFLFKRARGYQVIRELIMTFIVFLSGAFFPLKNLPLIVKIFTFINPLTYGVDGLRNVLIGYSEFSLILNIISLLVFGIIMMILGSYLFQKSISN